MNMSMNMSIDPMRVTIRELVEGYDGDSEDTGVVAYDGLLNVRPKYQREFVYDEKRQKAVIDSVLNGFPLNIMYWVRNEDGTYEMLDGQQRTLSICRFFDGEFSIEIDGNKFYSHNIEQTYPELYEQFMNYELLVYICEGTKEKQMAWFKTINIAGMALTDQELRNINYTGAWLTSAKKFFSKTRCPATQIGDGLISGTANRQDILETVLTWISGGEENICDYMAQHQNDVDASELIQYFKDVMDWVKILFHNMRPEMKGQPWGLLYNEYHENEYDPDELEEEICELMTDETITKQKGIYQYLFTRNASLLSARTFSPAIKNRVYHKQRGICAICGGFFTKKQMQADHIIPISKGGPTVESNCQMLCKECNRDKSSAMPDIEF